MPLFGFRTDKKHAQSHVQAEAHLAKASSVAGKKGGASQKGSRQSSSAKPAKISRAVVTQDPGAKSSGDHTAPMPAGSFGIVTDAVIRPRITEKSGLLSQTGVYTFEVGRSANKHSIAKAFKALYKITPVKVAVMNAPSKAVFLRGKKGRVAGFRKALVTLKEGEKIDFV